MTQLAKDPFATALATLTAEWPKEFTMEVDEDAFHNVPGLAYAAQLSRSMENMKHQAMAMDYQVAICHERARRMWVYYFRLKPDAKRPTPAIDDAIDDLTAGAIPLGENSE